MALPAQAIVVNQAAVAQTLVLLFLVFAAILFLVVLGLVAALGGRAQLRAVLIAFPSASAAAALVLLALGGTLSSSDFEHALLYAGIFLAVTALALVVRSFVSSRRK